MPDEGIVGVRETARTMPKSDLHVHLVGTMSASTAADLGQRFGLHVEGGSCECGRVSRAARFDCFIKSYSARTDLIRHADDLTRLVHEAAVAASADATHYLELSVSPYSHMRRGMRLEDIASGLAAGADNALKRGVVIRWILGMPGEQRYPDRVADATLLFAKHSELAGIVGVGLGGSEDGVPREFFSPWFRAAREMGLEVAVHAGETGSSVNVWSAVRDLGASRVGHALAAAYDEALLRYLVENQVVVEACPTSNLRTGQIDDLSTHPIQRFHEAGVSFVVGTDDPGMFNCSLSDEYEQVAALLAYEPSDLVALGERTIRAAFCEASVKSVLLEKLRVWHAGSGISGGMS